MHASAPGVAPDRGEAEPAMRIDSLRVENFRCFEDRTFTFDERFTLLVGANGAGKTALLDALAGAAGAVLPEGAKPNRPSIQLHDVRRTYERAGETGFFVDHYPAGISAEGYVLGVDHIWSRHRHTERSGRTRDVRTADIRSAMVDAMYSTHEAGAVELPFIGYYGTGRLGPEKREAKGRIIAPKVREPRHSGYRNCFDLTPQEKDMVAWVKRMALIQIQGNRVLETLAAVYGAIASCVENAVSAIFDFEEDDVVVEFTGRHRLPLRMLSAGQRAMTAMAADIARRCAQLNPHLDGRARLETPGIVLIDEIDQHLHPRWQRAVARDLREMFPRLQFVATTHSPFIIQSMTGIGRIIDLDSENDSPRGVSEQSIEDVAEDIMRIDIPQRSRRYREMMRVAEEYYKAIENTNGESGQDIDALREKLDELEEPFADNPAFVAFLRMERAAKNLRKLESTQ